MFFCKIVFPSEGMVMIGSGFPKVRKNNQIKTLIDCMHARLHVYLLITCMFDHLYVWSLVCLITCMFDHLYTWFSVCFFHFYILRKSGRFFRKTFFWCSKSKKKGCSKYFFWKHFVVFKRWILESGRKLSQKWQKKTLTWLLVS